MTSVEMDGTLQIVHDYKKDLKSPFILTLTMNKYFRQSLLIKISVKLNFAEILTSHLFMYFLIIFSELFQYE